jgi:hypothetical protein
MDKPTPPENINVRGPGCCILLALALAGVLAVACAPPPADPPAIEAAAPMLIPACAIEVALPESDVLAHLVLTPGSGQVVNLPETSIEVRVTTIGDLRSLRNPEGWPEATVSGRAEDGPDRPSPPAPDPIPGDPPVEDPGP